MSDPQPPTNVARAEQRVNTGFAVLGLALLLFLIIYGAKVVGGMHLLSMSPVPNDAIAQLQIGMPAEAVEQLLGPPAAVRNSDTWVYGNEHVRRVFYVEFDEQDQVRRFYLDD